MVDPQYCSFCGKANFEEEIIEKCGPLYGPINVGNKKAFVHEKCAMWTPEVYLDDNNKIKGLTKGLKRALEIKCSFCEEKGAGLGCYVKDCQKSYHFLCAKTVNSTFVPGKYYLLYCEQHASEITDSQKEILDSDGDEEEEEFYENS